MVPPVWVNLKKPLVGCVETIDQAVTTRFPQTRKRLSSVSEGLQATSTQSSGLAQLPLGLGRYLGITLLERTEAMLDSLLPIHPPALTMVTTQSSGKVERKTQDHDDAEDVECGGATGPRVERPLPFFRMFAVKLSSGSHSLQVTVISVQDTYSSLLQRLGVNRVWHLLKSFQAAEVKRELCDAARDPQGAATKAITFLGCEHALSSAVERLLTSWLAVKLLGARSAEWAAWVHSRGPECSSDIELPPSTVTIEDADGIRRPLPEMPHLTQLEQEAVAAVGLRLVVNKTFFELVPDSDAEDPEPTCARRTRSCEAAFGTHYQRQKVVLDPSDEAAYPKPTSSPPPTRLASPSPVARAPLPEVAAPLGATVDYDMLADADDVDSVVTASMTSEGAKAFVDAMVAEEQGQRTTIMLRHLPLDLSRSTLLRWLDDEGFLGCYSFVYLPIDFARDRGLGYALVNGVSAAHAEAMLRRLDGMMPLDGGEPWQVSWSEPCRTVAEHVERYRNSPVMHADMPDEYKPVLFYKGHRVEFPLPTRPIRLPRIRHLKPGDSTTISGPLSPELVPLQKNVRPS